MSEDFDPTSPAPLEPYALIDAPESFPELMHDATLKDAKVADIDIANFLLKAAHTGWGHVKSIAGIVAMTDTTIKAVKFRRDILNLQYGTKDNGAFNPARSVFPQYD